MRIICVWCKIGIGVGLRARGWGRAGDLLPELSAERRNQVQVLGRQPSSRVHVKKNAAQRGVGRNAAGATPLATSTFLDSMSHLL